jgi:hypothetical protein
MSEPGRWCRMVNTMGSGSQVLLAAGIPRSSVVLVPKRGILAGCLTEIRGRVVGMPEVSSIL